MPTMNHLFNRTVSTKRLVSTVDSGGSPISTFSTNIASLQVRVQQFKGQEPIQAGRKFSKVMYVLYCDHDADILMRDRITFNSVDYEIVEQYFEGNNNAYQKLLLAKAE